MLHYKTNYSVFDLIDFFDFADFDLFVFVGFDFSSFCFLILTNLTIKHISKEDGVLDFIMTSQREMFLKTLMPRIMV